MSAWKITAIPLRAGEIGIAPVPGRWGTYDSDLTALLRWAPALVLTMTTATELEQVGAGGFGNDLRAVGIGWWHLPIPDFGAPPQETEALWREASAIAHQTLERGGRVLAHCFGGCGRSGMALMRLMVEAGERPDYALERLRDARPCAVETEAQRAWAGKVWFEG